MAITADEFSGSDENGRRRLIAIARSIAPGIDALTGKAKQEAIAILASAAAELPAAGSRRTKAMSRNGSSVTYADAGSAFTDEDRDALRALCATGVVDAGPRGSFPTDRPLSRLWPETYT